MKQKDKFLDKINFIFNIFVEFCNHSYIVENIKELSKNYIGSKRTIKRRLDEFKQIDIENIDNTISNGIKKILKKFELYVENIGNKSYVFYIKIMIKKLKHERYEDLEKLLGYIILIQYEIYFLFCLVKLDSRIINNKLIVEEKLFSNSYLKELKEIYSIDELKKIINIVVLEDGNNDLFLYQRKFVNHLFEKFKIDKSENLIKQNIEFDEELSNRELRRIYNGSTMITKNKVSHYNDEDYFIYSIMYCLEKIRQKYLKETNVNKTKS